MALGVNTNLTWVLTSFALFQIGVFVKSIQTVVGANFPVIIFQKVGFEIAILHTRTLIFIEISLTINTVGGRSPPTIQT